MLKIKYIVLFFLLISLSLYTQQQQSAAQEAMQIVDLTVEGTTFSNDVIKLSSGLAKGKKI